MRRITGWLGVCALVGLVAGGVYAAYEDELPYRPAGPWIAMGNAICSPIPGFEWQTGAVGFKEPIGNQGVQAVSVCQKPGDAVFPWHEIDITSRVCTSLCLPRDAQFRIVHPAATCVSGQQCVDDENDQEVPPEPPFFYPSVFAQQHFLRLQTFGPCDGSCTYTAPPTAQFPFGYSWREWQETTEPVAVSQVEEEVDRRVRRKRGARRVR